MTADPTAFVLSHTAPSRAPLVPEILLHLATELTPIWHATEDWLATNNAAPPFWAFAWPGSQAIARHVLDNPATVAGKRVLDFAAGGGLAAIACLQAGAASVEAADIDPIALAAVQANAALNNVSVGVLPGDIVGTDCSWDTIVCGDICYEGPMSARIVPWLRRMAATGDVWIADPGRQYRPADGMEAFARYVVPTSLELEDSTQRAVVLYRPQPIFSAAC